VQLRPLERRTRSRRCWHRLVRPAPSWLDTASRLASSAMVRAPKSTKVSSASLRRCSHAQESYADPVVAPHQPASPRQFSISSFLPKLVPSASTSSYSSSGKRTAKHEDGEGVLSDDDGPSLRDQFKVPPVPAKRTSKAKGKQVAVLDLSASISLPVLPRRDEADHTLPLPRSQPRTTRTSSSRLPSALLRLRPGRRRRVRRRSTRRARARRPSRTTRTTRTASSSRTTRTPCGSTALRRATEYVPPPPPLPFHAGALADALSLARRMTSPCTRAS